MDVLNHLLAARLYERKRVSFEEERVVSIKNIFFHRYLFCYDDD